MEDNIIKTEEQLKEFMLAQFKDFFKNSDAVKDLRSICATELFGDFVEWASIAIKTMDASQVSVVCQCIAALQYIVKHNYNGLTNVKDLNFPPKGDSK